MTYRHLIFDFDGTLADTFPWFLSIMDDVADRFHINRVPKEKVDSLRHWNARDLLSSSQIPVWKIPLIAHHVKSRMAQDIEGIRLFDGVPEMLAALSKQGVRMTLASSNSQANVEAALGSRSAGLFDEYVCGVSLLGKASKYRRIFKRSGVPARETLCIGDELRDLEAAHEAGLPFGAVSWGFTHGAALSAEQPEHYFTSVHEIVDLVCPALRSP